MQAHILTKFAFFFLGHAVVVLAATNRLQALDDSLRRPGRLDKEIEIGVPSPGDRASILLKMLSHMQHSLSDDEVPFLCYNFRN